MSFDEQAKQWLTLAMTAKGPLPLHMQDPFLSMLVEIDRRANETGVKGKHLPAAIAMLEDRVHGSSVNASTTRTFAIEAYEQALPSAPLHVLKKNDGLSQVERWDLRLSNIHAFATAQQDYAHVVLGTTPLQFFGRGDAVHSAADDHVDDVLLMQIGEAFGLPLDIGPDMVLHLWIKPDDLASGCFDHVETTIEMT